MVGEGGALSGVIDRDSDRGDGPSDSMPRSPLRAGVPRDGSSCVALRRSFRSVPLGAEGRLVALRNASWAYKFPQRERAQAATASDLSAGYSTGTGTGTEPAFRGPVSVLSVHSQCLHPTFVHGRSGIKIDINICLLYTSPSPRDS